MSKYLIILIAAIIAVSAGCIVLFTTEDGSSSKVVYCIDGVQVDEQSCGDSVILKDIDPSYCLDDTFFGWNSSEEWGGITYMPGDRVSVDGEIKVHAILVKGSMKTDEKGNVDFALGNNDVKDNTDVDLRFFDDVESVTINEDSMRSIKKYGRSISLSYPDGMRMTMDENVISGCPSGALFIKINDVDHGRDVELAADSSKIDKISGSLIFDIPLGNGISKEAIFFQGNDLGGKEIEKRFNGNKVSITVEELGYRYLSLVKVTVIDINGSQIQPGDENYPKITSSGSKYFDLWHMFEKGDIFRISDLENGTYYNMSGAIKKIDGSYEVVIDNELTISIVAGNEKHNIILPEDQLGYTLTTDVLQVEDNERATLSYKIKSGYVDEDLIIKVNGNAVELDGMSRIFINNIISDVVVEVSGVYDVREYGIELPSEQEGFSITSSVEKLHHGQSYELTFTILPEFERGTDFAVLINGKEVDLLSGTMVVKNVMALQHIEVKGVQLQSFDVTAGEHTKLKVDGAEVTHVTCRDVITVHPDDGYSLPSSYESDLAVTIHKCDGGYNVTGTSKFPSVVKITTGENVQVNGQRSIYLCTEDVVAVSATSGYELPDDYRSILSGLGATNLKGNYSFGKDANLPSVYCVNFFGFDDKIYSKVYVSDKEKIPYPNNDPVKVAHNFEGWNCSNSFVSSDLNIYSVWTPNTYDVTVGVNIIVSFDDGSAVSFDNETVIKVNSDQGLAVYPNVGSMSLPNGYFDYVSNISLENGKYHVIGDTVFPSVTSIRYNSEDMGSRCELITVGPCYYLSDQPISNKEGCTFEGWAIFGNNEPIVLIDKVLNKNYELYEVWSKNDL